VKFQSPSLWRKLGQTKGMRNIRDSLAKKIGTHCHVSMSYTRSQLLYFFKMMIKNVNYAIGVAALLALEPEDIAFLTESKTITKKVQAIYDEAHSMIEAQIEHEIEVFGGFKAKSQKDQEEEPEFKQEQEVRVKKDVKPQSSLFDF